VWVFFGCFLAILDDFGAFSRFFHRKKGGLAGLEQKNRNLTKVKVDEMLGLVAAFFYIKIYGKK
jgi:hypothetical protein